MTRRLFTEAVYATVKNALTHDWLPAAEVANRAERGKHIQLNSGNIARVMRYMWKQGMIERQTNPSGKMFYRRNKGEDADSN